MERQTITVKEASKYLGVSKDLVYTLVRQKQLPHIKLGKRILFRKDILDDWLRIKETESVGE